MEHSRAGRNYARARMHAVRTCRSSRAHAHRVAWPRMPPAPCKSDRSARGPAQLAPGASPAHFGSETALQRFATPGIAYHPAPGPV